MDLFGILKAAGAAAVGAVSLDAVKAYETEGMSRRREGLPFFATHAFVAAFPHFTGHRPGNLPLYLRGEDYVNANKRRLEDACLVLRALFPDFHFYASGNAYPLPAVEAGRLAGLGKIGRHGLLILPDYGTTVTLGAIFCDMPLPAMQEEGYCDGCGVCLRACPTSAIFEDETGRHFNKELCFAYISQQKELTPSDTALLRQSPWVYGCDDCQNACPANRSPLPTTLPEYTENPLDDVNEGNWDSLAIRHQGEKKWATVRRNAELVLGWEPKQ